MKYEKEYIERKEFCYVWSMRHQSQKDEIWLSPMTRQELWFLRGGGQCSQLDKRWSLLLRFYDWMIEFACFWMAGELTEEESFWQWRQADRNAFGSRRVEDSAVRTLKFRSMLGVNITEWERKSCSEPPASIGNVRLSPPLRKRSEWKFGSAQGKKCLVSGSKQRVQAQKWRWVWKNLLRFEGRKKRRYKNKSRIV